MTTIVYQCDLRRGTTEIRCLQLRGVRAGDVVDVRFSDPQTGELREWSDGWTITRCWPAVAGAVSKWRAAC
jgi:hypothetical protein